MLHIPTSVVACTHVRENRIVFFFICVHSNYDCNPCNSIKLLLIHRNDKRGVYFSFSDNIFHKQNEASLSLSFASSHHQLIKQARLILSSFTSPTQKENTESINDLFKFQWTTHSQQQPHRRRVNPIKLPFYHTFHLFPFSISANCCSVRRSLPSAIRRAKH